MRDALTADEWNADAADAIARSENIVLTAAHWRVISCWREMAAREGHRPAVGDLVACCHVTASEIRKLFPGATTALLSRIAGLPD